MPFLSISRLDKAALQQNIAGMKSDAAGIKANLQKLEAGDNKVIGALIAYYEKVETALAKAEADLSDAALSSQVKRSLFGDWRCEDGVGRKLTKLVKNPCFSGKNMDFKHFPQKLLAFSRME